jgi:glucan phosphoethanolaminetransferase (alkaline phosphatase superfamily)
MNFKIKNLLKIKKWLKEVPWFLGRHAFLIILFFVFLSVAFGGFLYYNYVTVAKNSEPKYNSSAVSFSEDIYQMIQSQWNQDSQTLQKLLDKPVVSPFISN